MIHSLKEFRDNTRSGADTLMSNVVIGLSNADLSRARTLRGVALRFFQAIC